MSKIIPGDAGPETRYKAVSRASERLAETAHALLTGEDSLNEQDELTGRRHGVAGAVVRAVAEPSCRRRMVKTPNIRSKIARRVGLAPRDARAEGRPMARFPRLDPDYPEGSVLSTKLAPSDAERVIELATAAGLTKSGFVRQAVLDALEREDEPPPDG